MTNIKGSKTEANLKTAFSLEAQANRLYKYFASRADVEGQMDVAALFRAIADGKNGQAFGHLKYLKQTGDPITGLPMGSTRKNLRSSIDGESYKYAELYPEMAQVAREEGFTEIADWFEMLTKAERTQANRFQKTLDTLVD
ncbi:MAG: rubrerythrin family protein [Burkholderiaceae bacterium]|nr:rubrerythrin family protein [Burkholderiaceae bacterium]